MDKTLLEHHYHYRIAALADDLTDRCARRLVVVETMAKELGWRHVCAAEAIEIKTQNIFTA